MPNSMDRSIKLLQDTLITTRMATRTTGNTDRQRRQQEVYAADLATALRHLLRIAVQAEQDQASLLQRQAWDMAMQQPCTPETLDDQQRLQKEASDAFDKAVAYARLALELEKLPPFTSTATTTEDA